MAERVTVEAISTSDYPTAAKRPAFSALDGSRFAATFGWNPPEWRDGLQRCLAARDDRRKLSVMVAGSTLRPADKWFH